MLLGQVSLAASGRITADSQGRQHFAGTVVGSWGISLHLLGPSTISSQKSKELNISMKKTKKSPRPQSPKKEARVVAQVREATATVLKQWS